VQAGIAAGLLARGTPVRDAIAWTVWTHDEAGRLPPNDTARSASSRAS